MTNYKSYFLRQIGIRENQEPNQEIDLDTAAANGDTEIEQDDTQPSEIPPEVPAEPINLKSLSPTAISTPVIALSVKGSATGGLPSGTTPSKLGGYTPIPTEKNNSAVVDKTPSNGKISSSEVTSGNTQVDTGELHPHQIQKGEGQTPDAVGNSQFEINVGETKLTNEQLTMLQNKLNERSKARKLNGRESLLAGRVTEVLNRRNSK